MHGAARMKFSTNQKLSSFSEPTLYSKLVEFPAILDWHSRYYKCPYIGDDGDWDLSYPLIYTTTYCGMNDITSHNVL